jgi:hypothetical protein
LLQTSLNRFQCLRDIVGKIGMGSVVEEIIGGQPLCSCAWQQKQQAKAG